MRRPLHVVATLYRIYVETVGLSPFGMSFDAWLTALGHLAAEERGLRPAPAATAVDLPPAGSPARRAQAAAARAAAAAHAATAPRGAPPKLGRQASKMLWGKRGRRRRA